MSNISITPGKNNVGAYINNVDLNNVNKVGTIQIKEALNQISSRTAPLLPLVKDLSCA